MQKIIIPLSEIIKQNFKNTHLKLKKKNMKTTRRFCYVTDQYNLIDIEYIYIYILKSVLCYLLYEKRYVKIYGLYKKSLQL